MLIIFFIILDFLAVRLLVGSLAKIFDCELLNFCLLKERNKNYATGIGEFRFHVSVFYFQSGMLLNVLSRHRI